MSERKIVREVRPSLESIVVRGKYKVFSSFKKFLSAITASMNKTWRLKEQIGESVSFEFKYEIFVPKDKKFEHPLEEKIEALKNMRTGAPLSLHIIAIEHLPDGIVIDVACHPVMYYLITQAQSFTFPDYVVEEALIECQRFIKSIMSTVRTEVIQPVSVYPIIPRTEIKSRLFNLGLKEIVQKLDRAERHIVQNNFEASLTSSRTAFEKMIDWQMKKRGLEKTNNYKNDLDRLRSRGHLDVETTKLLQSYYSCLSNIGVHEKTKIPIGIFEAQMGYGTTLIMLQYFANKLP